jgi:hypothetical protein
MSSGRTGLVVIELAVSAEGRVLDSSILESFDDRASAATSFAIKTWRFRTLHEALPSAILNCEGCIRINRLVFDYELRDGKAQVTDLAQEALMRRAVSEQSPHKP